MNFSAIQFVIIYIFSSLFSFVIKILVLVDLTSYLQAISSFIPLINLHMNGINNVWKIYSILSSWDLPYTICNHWFMELNTEMVMRFLRVSFR